MITGISSSTSFPAPSMAISTRGSILLITPPSPLSSPTRVSIKLFTSSSKFVCCAPSLFWINDNLEARAAAFYWKTLFHDIENFTRDRDGIPPNNLLNYGYAILRAVIARSLVTSGLLPTLGIHHHNRYNAYCLADDIMEPYRPFIDRLVYQLYSENKMELTKEVKASLLSIPTIDVRISGKRSPLMIAASQTTASLYKCFSGESRKIIYPEF